MIDELRKVIKRLHYPLEVMLVLRALVCHKARVLIAGIETMHMIRKGQLKHPKRPSLVRSRSVAGAAG